MENILIQILSWNVNTKAASKSKLKELKLLNLINTPNFENQSNPPDLIAVGFQELLDHFIALTYSPEESYFGTNNILNQFKKNQLNILLSWVEEINVELAALHSNVRYAPLFASRVVAIGLCIFVRMDSGGSNGYISEDPIIQGEYDDIVDANAESKFGILNCKFGYKKNLTIRSANGVGLGGFYGNKGAVAFSFDLQLAAKKDHADPQVISICFLNAHLQAHEGHHYFLCRNEDLKQIFDCLVLSPVLGSLSRSTSLFYRNPIGFLKNFIYPYHIDNEIDNEEGIKNLYSHNVIFLFGDLNYRLKKNFNFTREELLSNLKENNVEKIFEFDELQFLLKNVNRGVSEVIVDSISQGEFNFPSCYNGFEEHKVTFPPTYKFSIKNDKKKNNAVGDETTGNNVEYSTKRFPAFTDRILFKKTLGSAVNTNNWINSKVLCHYYNSVTKMHGFSDHQPISGLFEIQGSFKDAINKDGSKQNQLTDCNRLKRIDRVEKAVVASLKVKSSKLYDESLLVDMKLVKKLRWERILKLAVIPSLYM
ncbi:hypothetical protein HDU92_005936, partial [Lobulomyces angularis]